MSAIGLPIKCSLLRGSVAFHLHDVDSHSYGCSDEHDVSIYVKFLADRPQHSFVDQYGRENVDERDTEDRRYDL